MTPRPGAAPKEKLYHSQLSKTPDGITLKFTSDTKDSKFADSAGYVFVEMEDGTDAMMILENDDIRGLVDHTPQKRWVVVKGEGKADGAWMVVEEPDGNPVLPQHSPSEARQKAAPASAPGSVGMLAASMACDVLSYMESNGHPLDSAGKASILATILIAMDRRA